MDAVIYTDASIGGLPTSSSGSRLRPNLRARRVWEPLPAPVPLGMPHAPGRLSMTRAFWAQTAAHREGFSSIDVRTDPHLLVRL